MYIKNIQDLFIALIARYDPQIARYDRRNIRCDPRAH